MTPNKVIQILGPSDGGVQAHVNMVARLQREAGQRVAVLGAPWSGAQVWALFQGVGQAGLLHAHGLKAGAGVALVRRLKCAGRLRTYPRLLVTLHNYPVGSRVTRRMARFLGWVVAREADVVLGVSRDITNWMSGLGARQVERALVPAPTLKPPTANRKQTRKQLGLTDNEPVLLTVARLAPQKGVPLLLDTAARLTEQTAVKPVWLVAGEGPLRVAAEKTALEHALPIRFLGRRHDVANLYGAADLVVGTSYWEGQPVALQEALAQGCAVVATAVGGTAETVGSGAELVAPEPGRLAEAIIRLLNHPEQLTDLRHRAACQAARLPSEQSLLQQLDRLGGTESGPSDHI